MSSSGPAKNQGLEPDVLAAADVRRSIRAILDPDVEPNPSVDLEPGSWQETGGGAVVRTNGSTGVEIAVRGFDQAIEVVTIAEELDYDVPVAVPDRVE